MKEILLDDSEFEFSFARSSGPGGQNVNKVNSKTVLKWDIGQSAMIPSSVKHRFSKKYGSSINSKGMVVISSDRFRDQGRNIKDCIQKLQEMLESVRLPPKPRRKTKPTLASKKKRLESKKKNADKKKQRQSQGEW